MNPDIYQPTATYRIQFHAGFTFHEATNIIPYLHDLGISHIYTSPLLKARPGSAHGYDIVDHGSLNPELGGYEGFALLTEQLQKYNMGLIMDIVPNHMGIGQSDNNWWLDVIEWGRSSSYAHFFDIEWFPDTDGMHGKVLLPFLGDLYGNILGEGHFKLKYKVEDGFSIWYYEHRFPVYPATYSMILEHCLSRTEWEQKKIPEEEQETIKALLIEAKRLRSKPKSAKLRKAHRSRGETFKKKLAEEYTKNPTLRKAIDGAEDAFSGNETEKTTLMHKLLETQNYRLAFWKVASHEINYRRFFQINELAGLRVEEPDVFEASHGFILELIKSGMVHGLRIDHIDGLYDPAGYLETLQERISQFRDILGFKESQFPVYIEKILEDHENLRSWPIHGTTGYDALDSILRVFPAAEGVQNLTGYYTLQEGQAANFNEMTISARRQVMAQELGSELEVLASEMTHFLKKDPSTRDFTKTEVRQALREIAAHFPVYRSYVTEMGTAAEDERDLQWAFGLARRSRTLSHPHLFDVLESILKGQWQLRKDKRIRAEVLNIIKKFQQYTGPVMAKGIEDTAFYRHGIIIARNEVGSGPERKPLQISEFHQRMLNRLQWPCSLVTTATHDTKRSEDVRMRIIGITEYSEQWIEHVDKWKMFNRRARQLETNSPSSHDEYFFYQTLYGVWPLIQTIRTDDNSSPKGRLKPEDQFFDLRKRLSSCMIKSAREANVRTSWLNPDIEYETEFENFIEHVLEPESAGLFLKDVNNLMNDKIFIGICNSLTQLVLRLTIPGVPDTYQGTELWDDSLVDPDNRRAVDYETRRSALEHCKKLYTNLQSNHRESVINPSGPARQEFNQQIQKTNLSQYQNLSLLSEFRNGHIKLYILWRILLTRRTEESIFAGNYTPLSTDGKFANHIISYLRQDKNKSILIAVPIQTGTLSRDFPLRGTWENTRIIMPAKSLTPNTLPENTSTPIADSVSPTVYENIFTGQEIKLQNHFDSHGIISEQSISCRTIFRDLPVAVLKEKD